MADNPIREVTLNSALNISLDNYYDLIKAQVGGLRSDEFLQLKLVADTVDISDQKKASEGGYVWYSKNMILQRADRAIVPTAVEGEIQTSAVKLHAVYGRFLKRLRTYVSKGVLSLEEQQKVADLDSLIAGLRREMERLELDDRERWLKYAATMGYEPTDDAAFAQWSSRYGSGSEIEEKQSRILDYVFERTTILDRQYPEPSDEEVIRAEALFDSPAMRLRYPIHEDNEYVAGDDFSVEYLARLPAVATGLFDDWRVIGWDKSLETLKSGTGGAFTATLDASTERSTSITTDWRMSGGGGWRFIRAKASASEHTRIQEDFKKATSLRLAANSCYRVNIIYPQWFQPALFSHRHVAKNPHNFEDFFGPQGALLYYPTAMIVIRGFSIAFESQQKWEYDYKRSFSASGGGGFNAFGIRFGGKGSYSRNETEHRVEQSDTTLKISDGEKTVRFVGYAVAKNNVFEKNIDAVLSDVRVFLEEADKLQEADAV